MLSYVHDFHAGNFADVHKHVVLCLTLDYLLRKPAALACIDVYAGSGDYDLASSQARKTGEAEQGIAALWALSDWPAPLAPYRTALAQEHGRPLRRYPGSPLLAARLLRPEDRLILNELHPRAAEALAGCLGDDPRVALHRRDALEALVALVPPTQKRGLVLVDPSYERKEEYRLVLKAMERGLQRWPNGVWLVWYPLLGGASPHRQLVDGLKRLAPGDVLISELHVPALTGMRGSGMLVLNPPWTLAQELRSLSSWFSRLGEGRARLEVVTSGAAPSSD